MRSRQRPVGKAAILLHHRRRAHVTDQRLRATAKSNGIVGLHYYGALDKCECKGCMLVNAKKAPFKVEPSRTRSTIPGERMHSDLKEVSVLSRKGFKYAICFVDDCTRRGKTYYMKRKSETLEKWREFLEKECAVKKYDVRYLRSDNGGEYIGEEMQAFNNVRGIAQEYSPPHCQSGNGVAEVFWRDTFRLVRSILWDQQRGDEWWPAALEMAVLTRNHLMTSSVKDVPPECAWQKKNIDVAHHRVPLCTCYAFVEKENREGTLAPRRIEGILVGYARQSHSYLVYNEEADRVYSRRYADVQFDERCKAPDDTEPDVLVVDTLLAQMELEAQQDAAKPKEVEAPPMLNKGFVRTTKPWSVSELSDLFNVEAEDYLSYLREHEGWYKELTKVEQVINTGADVPIPVVLLKLPPVKQEPSEEELVQEEPDVKTIATPKGDSHRVPRKRRKVTVSTTINGVKHDVLLSKGVITRSRAQGNAAQNASGLARVAVALQANERELADCMLLFEETAKAARMESAKFRCNTDSKSCLAQDAEHMHEAKQETHAAEPLLSKTKVPKSYDAARKGDDSAKWHEAEVNEWNGLWRMGAFEDDSMHGQKLHHLIWLYKIKSDGTLKVRLVLDGRRQDPSTYGDISSPTMRLTSFRILLALAAQKGWDILADDATQAFLNAERPEDMPLWAAYPQGYSKSGRALLLRKMLYGLHDAPMGWFKEVRKHLVEEQGLIQSRNDECLFYRPDGKLYVICHVDDFAATGETEALAEYRTQLYQRFKMTGGDIKEYFGLNVTNDKEKGIVTLSVESHMEKIMKKLKLQPKAYTTPMNPEAVLPKRHGPCEDLKLQKRYRTLVGSAQHAAVTCRPDAAYAVRELASHLTHPLQAHIQAAERLIQYLYHTRKERLEFHRHGRKGDPILTTFYGTCDASYNTTHDSKGITGWAYQIGNGAVAWKCKAQPIVSLSSCEAELIAIDYAVRELRYLHKLLEDFGQNVTTTPTIVGQDNTSTITLCESRHFNQRTKHLALRYHHVGDEIRKGTVTLKYLCTDEMTADILTKALYHNQFVRHREVLLGHKQLLWSESRNSQSQDKR
jgi:transposase InsO family protein